MTLLSVYVTENNSVRLATADLLVAVAGAAGTLSGGTTINSTLGWMEIGYGGPGAIGQASIGSPSGSGALLDATTLEGQTLFSGAYSGQILLSLTQAGKSVGGTQVTRFWRYNTSSQVYTPIGSISIVNQAINSTSAQSFVFPGTNLSTTGFVTNETLYIDTWMNVTSNSMTAGGQFNVFFSNSGTLGIASISFVTPGYQATPTKSSIPRQRTHRSFGRLVV